MKRTVLAKELINYWLDNETKVLDRRHFLEHLKLSLYSAKTKKLLTFQADCAYVWEKGDCITIDWDTFNKLSEIFNYINVDQYEKWRFGKKETIIFTSNENRLQKQKTDVVRGDDTEGNRVQSRKRKASITVGHLSYKSVKG